MENRSAPGRNPLNTLIRTKDLVLTFFLTRGVQQDEPAKHSHYDPKKRKKLILYSSLVTLDKKWEIQDQM